MYFGIFAKDSRELFDVGRKYGSTCAYNPFEGRDFNPFFFAVSAYPVQKGRRRKHVRDTLITYRLNDLFRVNEGRSGGIHVRDDGSNSQSGPEKRKKRKGGKINFIPRQVEVRTDLMELRIKISMGIDHPFCRSSTACGKEDGGHIIGSGISHFQWAATSLHEPTNGVSTPEPSFSCSDKDFDVFEKGRQNFPQHMGKGNAYECLGITFFQAGSHPAHTHTGINHHGNSPRLEKGKNNREEFQGGFYHQYGSNALCDPLTHEARGQPVRLLVQLLKSQVSIRNPSCFVSSCGTDDRFPVWVNFRNFC